MSPDTRRDFPDVLISERRPASVVCGVDGRPRLSNTEPARDVSRETHHVRSRQRRLPASRRLEKERRNRRRDNARAGRPTTRASDVNCTERRLQLIRGPANHWF